MRTLYLAFGVDTAAANLLCTTPEQWPHKSTPNYHVLHLPLAKLDARGLRATCRMLGDIAFINLQRLYPDRLATLDLSPPLPAEAERLIGRDEAIAAPGPARATHVAVGLSDQGLHLQIAKHDGLGATDIGRSVALTLLGALGPEEACLALGKIILANLVQLHPDAFARYPALINPD